jgi:hypothetical protein
LLPPPSTSGERRCPTFLLRNPAFAPRGESCSPGMATPALLRAAALTAVASVCQPSSYAFPVAGAAAFDRARRCPLATVPSHRQGHALSSCLRTHVRRRCALVHDSEPTLFLARPSPKPRYGRAFLPLSYLLLPSHTSSATCLAKCQNSGSKPVGKPSAQFSTPVCAGVRGKVNPVSPCRSCHCHPPVRPSCRERVLGGA